MTERKKLELKVNTPTQIELLFDQPKVGSSSYGQYYLYAVRNGDGTTEYSYFATEEVHEQLKELKKGAKVELTKLASQRGKKLISVIDVRVIKDNSSVTANPDVQNVQTGSNYFLESMRQSFKDALAIQEEFNGMANVNQIAVTLFIQRTKNNNFATA